MKYMTRRVMDGDDDKEGPEQRQTVADMLFRP